MFILPPMRDIIYYLCFLLLHSRVVNDNATAVYAICTPSLPFKVRCKSGTCISFVKTVICDWIYGNRSKSHIGSYKMIDFKDSKAL